MENFSLELPCSARLRVCTSPAPLLVTIDNWNCGNARQERQHLLVLLHHYICLVALLLFPRWGSLEKGAVFLSCWNHPSYNPLHVYWLIYQLWVKSSLRLLSTKIPITANQGVGQTKAPAHLVMLLPNSLAKADKVLIKNVFLINQLLTTQWVSRMTGEVLLALS